MRTAFELVCFDLDGTLVDSAPDLNHALGAALHAVGYPAPTQAQTRSWIGDGVENLLRRALQHAGADLKSDFSAALRAFHSSYSENLFRDSRLYADVESVLRTLRASGLRLSCITNKRIGYAQALLEKAGIAGQFEFVFGGDTFPEKKPHPRQLLEAARRVAAAPGNCVMIGDADTDSNAALSAGFHFVWARFGYSATLSSRDAATVIGISAFAEIPEVLAAMMPQP